MGANKQHSGLIWVIYSSDLGISLGTYLYPWDLVVREGDTIVGEMKVFIASSEARKVDFRVRLRHIGMWGSTMQEELFKV